MLEPFFYGDRLTVHVMNYYRPTRNDCSAEEITAKVLNGPIIGDITEHSNNRNVQAKLLPETTACWVDYVDPFIQTLTQTYKHTTSLPSTLTQLISTE